MCGLAVEVGRTGAQRGSQVEALAVAQDLEGDLVARREAQHLQVERIGAVDRKAVDGGDDVTGLEAGVVGRAARHDRAALVGAAADPGAGGDRKGLLLGDLGVDLAVDDADVRSRDGFTGLGLLDDGLGQVDGEREADAVVDMPACAVVMPMSSPSPLKSAPPELPELTAASVWMRWFRRLLARLFPKTSMLRSSPLMMPTAALLGKRPSGLPMEMASWPTRMSDESPSVTVGRSSASTSTKAKSVSVSTPVTSPSSTVPSSRMTVTSLASPTTWPLVMIESVARDDDA